MLALFFLGMDSQKQVCWVGPWTTQGIKAQTFSVVENPSITCRSFVFKVLHPQIQQTEAGVRTRWKKSVDKCTCTLYTSAVQGSTVCVFLMLKDRVIIVPRRLSQTVFLTAVYEVTLFRCFLAIRRWQFRKIRLTGLWLFWQICPENHSCSYTVTAQQ